jgi:hypothetical protein
MARGLEDDSIRFANATIACKWEMAALWLYISLTATFHLSEILTRYEWETWHDLFGSHFFSVTVLVNAFLISYVEGPTLA